MAGSRAALTMQAKPSSPACGNAMMAYEILKVATGAPANCGSDWRIAVRIERDAASISRALDPVVRQGLIPERLTVAADGTALDLMLELRQVNEQVTTHLCALLRNMPAVRDVRCDQLPTTGSTGVT